ncbi:helix-turn-helix domain-containing protein [Fuerstiella marisgermanici]|uniref:HTH cro/C1-type domain-containing protein n=1 Tax=Fuerstiella marisgermanici TaxID=1891926 RepID=A0A1P8WKG1_9PLAN|nr:helix-turn-helix transcriptional regulator [Fuerstiella marisgermanici]APZ94537.1 hypothetical protein Fuma_04169 [Fuerstiella marisgermanici]
MFGRNSAQLDKYEVSQLVVQYARSRIVERTQKHRVTQAEIAHELNVSQAMINGVVHGKKFFSEERLSDYAQSLHMEYWELLAEILNASGNSESTVGLDEVRSEDSPSATLLYDYERYCDMIDRQRRLSFEVAEKSFDGAQAFSEVLRFVADYVTKAGIGGVKISLISVGENRAFAVRRAIAAPDTADCQLFPNLPSWIAESVRQNSEPETESRILVLTIPAQVREYRESQWLYGEDASKVVVQQVFQEDSFDGRQGTSHALLFSFNEGELSEFQHDRLYQILFLASRLGEKIASYGLRDRLRCAHRVIAAQAVKEKILAPGWTDELTKEPREHFAHRFLEEICETDSLGADIATADMWLYQVPENRFVSPNEYFRCVSERHRDCDIRDSQGQLRQLYSLYEESHHNGNLVPRANGRTSYMVANEIATFTNSADNDGTVVRWSSAPDLELGAFIGIPFSFFPTGGEGVGHISVIYLRCIGDLEDEVAATVVKRVTRLMRQSAEYKTRFVPLFSLNRQFTVAPRRNDNWGKWYDVFQLPRKKNVARAI